MHFLQENLIDSFDSNWILTLLLFNLINTHILFGVKKIYFCCGSRGTLIGEESEITFHEKNSNLFDDRTAIIFFRNP